MIMTNEGRLFHDHIVEDPQIMVGQPVIRGTRIPVERILEHLATTPDFDDLFAAYPRLKIEDVQAALAFALEAVEAKRGSRKEPAEAVPAKA
jgi:uncharacterized protein (DUF433 family)